VCRRTVFYTMPQTMVPLGGHMFQMRVCYKCHIRLNDTLLLEMIGRMFNFGRGDKAAPQG